MQRALDTWAFVSRDALGLPADSLPWVVLFDARCTWHLAPRTVPTAATQDLTDAAGLRFGSAPVIVHAQVHGDTVRLPSGQAIPARPTAFAPRTGTHVRASSLWRFPSSGVARRRKPRTRSIGGRVPPHGGGRQLRGLPRALAHAPSGTSAPAVLSRLQPGRYWSQDIGLSIMLVLDALLPDWRAQVLREDPPSVYALLAQAAGSD